MQKFDGNILMAGVGLVLLMVALVSGILVWAIPGGFLSSGITLWLTKDVRSSAAVGIIVAAVITAFGIANFISPGWYGAYL